VNEKLTKRLGLIWSFSTW